MAITKLNSLAIPPDTVVESDISFPLDSASFTGDLTVDTDTLVVDSTNNRVGIGRSDPKTKLHVSDASSEAQIRVNSGISASSAFQSSNTDRAWRSGVEAGGDYVIKDVTSALDRLTIDSSGNVGIGETSPSRKSHTKSTEQIVSHFESTSATRGLITVADANTTSDSYVGIGANGDDLELRAGETTKVTVLSGGNVGIGTTDPNSALEVRGGAGSASRIHISSSSAGQTSFDGSGSGLLLSAGGMNTTSKFTPSIQFASTDAEFTTTNPKVGAAINGIAAQTYSADTTGGMHLAFYTTPNNPGTSQTTTERMRIDSSGRFMVGQTNPSTVVDGAYIRTNGSGFIATSTECLMLNRQGTDGTVIDIRQANTSEGSISVSGTTVSYNGGHLSRWSQSDIDDVSAIYKGTVMSNLDEMCEWDNEDNEQLNKTKVSDVEGDVNVAGVFVAEDNSDDLSDYYLAMTGDMIIRIAQGTTVQRGDLLMSAGDGTAKPQDDDIVRSKTIAKVTSTNVTCTYADGSYCVPCVVMAC